MRKIIYEILKYEYTGRENKKTIDDLVSGWERRLREQAIVGFVEWLETANITRHRADVADTYMFIVDGIKKDLETYLSLKEQDYERDNGD